MTVVSKIPDTPATELDRQIILNIFSAIGRCRFLDEKHFDACTALSGSGPAFACIFLEAMADGAVMMGLPRQAAVQMAAQSTSRGLDRSDGAAMQGAARLVLQTGQHPAAVKDTVTSALREHFRR